LPPKRVRWIDRQAQACRRFASQRGWARVELYIDNDISAFTGVSRPAYRRVLDDVRLGRLAAIVTWDAHRLHRSTRALRTSSTSSKRPAPPSFEACTATDLLRLHDAPDEPPGPPRIESSP
jgi:hypothetical protein